MKLVHDWGRWRSIWVMRLFVSVGLASLIIWWFWSTDPAGGADTKVRLQFMAWSIVAALPTYLIRRSLTGAARSHDAWEHALDSNSLAPAVLWVGHTMLSAIIFAVIMVTCVGSARADSLPPAAVQLLPVLVQEQRAHWPQMPDPPTLGAQVEQETCVSLKSRGCWNPRTELKTSREYGFGLGQITVTRGFDNFAAARGLDPSLRAWAWADRYDPRLQLRTLVLMDLASFRGLDTVPEPGQRLAMTFAAYNGGLGGVRSDRRLCAQVPGCDPGRWWGNVELHSLKARAAVAGYGQSFFAVNRGYVRSVMVTRRPRYVQAMGVA